MARHQIIVNPTSGRGAGETSVPAIEQELRRLGIDFELTRTERPWHASELAQQAVKAGFDVVVAVGGDGTANEVLNGLMLAKEAGAARMPAMGMIAVGRGNDVSFGAGIPPGVVPGCLTLARGIRHTIDVGHVVGGLYPQGRFFGNGVGIGFDAQVGFEALKLKGLSGFPSYIVATLMTVFLYYRPPHVRIELDGETLDQRALMVSVMNGRRMGGGFMMAPSSLIDDGLFDLCIAGAVSRPGVFGLIPRFMKGTQEGHPAIRMTRSRRVTVTAVEGVLPAHADGETLCTDGKQLSMELRPQQIEVVYQATGAAA